MPGMDIAPIVRTQDYTIIKQNEDSKNMIDQSNVSHVMEQKEINQSQEVVGSNRSEYYNKKQDAREKGSNEYYGDGGKSRQKKEIRDRVVVKKNGGFDFKV